MSGDLNVADLACGWNPSGDVDFSQVDITIRDKQVKMDLCPEDLRQYWLSQRMSAAANQESVPFEEVIADYYVKRISKYNESYLIDGDGTGTGIKDQVTGANGATVSAAPAAFTLANAVEQALNIFDAVNEASKDRDDLIMIMSPANFNILRRALVAQNYYHYDQGDGRSFELPGANVTVVKTSGLTGSDYVACGPSSMIVAGTGLEDDSSTVQFFFDKGQDVVKFIAKWRLGVAVSQVDQFGTNGLA
jgi:HK97 family phage major capsid protein